MARGHEYEQRELARRVRAIMWAIAGGSPTKLARILNDADPDETSSRVEEDGRRIESDRRTIARWLSASMLMEDASRVKLLEKANELLAARGQEILPDDFLVVDTPDPLVEINRKLDLLLADRGLQLEPDVTEAAAALQRLEKAEPGRDGRDELRTREGGA